MEVAAEKMYEAFKSLFEGRKVTKTPMKTTFKHLPEDELDVTDKEAVKEHKRFPYRELLGTCMWLTAVHFECWYATRVLARHAHHHTSKHREALIDLALFIYTYREFGVRYTASHTDAVLRDHIELWALSK